MAVTAQQLVVRRGAFTLAVDRFAADDGGTALLGPNGAGKTTLLLALQGLVSHGGIVARPARCAGVFADPAFLRGSVRWNIAVVLRSVRGLDEGAADWCAAEALESVGLTDAAHGDARRLSSGQRQRLALARALALEPQALFLDEPFANVDADGRASLRELVAGYVRRSKCAFVIATQALADAAALCREAMVLDRGRDVELLPARAIGTSRHPYLRALVAEAASPWC